MAIRYISAIVIIWTLASVILNLCGVGKFAEFPITAWPWDWSCLFVLYWTVIVSALRIALRIACTIGLAWCGVSRQQAKLNEAMVLGKVARLLIIQDKVDEAYTLAKDTWGDRMPDKVKKALMEAAQKK